MKITVRSNAERLLGCLVENCEVVSELSEKCALTDQLSLAFHSVYELLGRVLSSSIMPGISGWVSFRLEELQFDFDKSYLCVCTIIHICI